MSQLLQLALQGAAIGAVYSLVALGRVLTYKATEVRNFAHGDLVMASVFLGWWLMVDRQLRFWATVLLVAALQLMMMVFVGGLGSLRGAILGAILIATLPTGISILKVPLPGSLQEGLGLVPLVSGIVLALFVILEPKGLDGRWRIGQYLREFPLAGRNSSSRNKSYMRSERCRALYKAPVNEFVFLLHEVLAPAGGHPVGEETGERIGLPDGARGRGLLIARFTPRRGTK